MALFSSLGQGDVWSISGINFASPVNDILDKETYTIEELLAETELIQEVKTGNQRLIQFLCRDDIIEKLVYYVVTPAPSDSDDLRSFKYPYMSCEIFCCEVPYISETLVQQKYLTQLFSILNTESELDHYLAGYFEKVLEMLFRRMTVPMMSFLNEGGIPLLKKFLYHIYNYSIMQIVQRVMLPHIPFADIENLSPSEKLLHQCDWSFKKETCDLLCDCMLNPRTPDVPSHVSDMLITVLQLSPHESSFLLNIYNSNILTQLLETAFSLNNNNNNNTNNNNNNNNISETRNNVVLASISILESLISRLCETVNPFEYNNGGNGNDANNGNGNDQKIISNLQSAENIERITKSLIGYIPYLTKGLETYLNPIHEPIVKESSEVIENEIKDNTKIYSQTGQVYTKLSSKGLQLVRFVESLVRLANDEMDEALCVNGTLKVCMELMFSYELHSLLHLSVQRIVLILFEGGANERTIRYLLEDCELINRIISIVSEESGTDGISKRVAGLRRPIVGHIITIGQSISSTLHGGNNDSVDGSVSGDINSGRPVDSILRRVMVETGLIEKWDLFEKQEFHTFLEKQVAIGAQDNGLEASPQSHTKLQLEMALEALSLNDNSNNWPPANKLDDDDIPTRLSDTIDIDEDDDDDDNEYAIYHYNQSHRYNQSNDNAFSDFEATPTFDAAFADFSTVNNNNNNTESSSSSSQENHFEPAFEATFDTPADSFASFPDSSFPDSSWNIPTQSSNPSGNDGFDPFGIGSSSF